MDRRSDRACELVVVAALAGCVAPPPPTSTDAVEPTPAPTLERERTPVAPELDRVAELALDRGGCELPCPSDLTLVDADGELWYWGRAESERLGVHRAWVSRPRLGLVAASLVASEYPSLLDEYDSRRSHARRLITAAVVDDARTVVADRGRHAPESAQQLVDALVRLLDDARWDPGPLEVGRGAARAPACVDLVDRVAGSCAALLGGDEPQARCRLFLSPALAAGAGHLPPEYCAALVDAHDRAPPAPVTAPRPRRGPLCVDYLRDLAEGCGDQLRQAPVAGDEARCYTALTVTSILSRAPESDPEFDGIRLRADEYWCGRWSGVSRRDREYDPW